MAVLELQLELALVVVAMRCTSSTGCGTGRTDKFGNYNAVLNTNCFLYYRVSHSPQRKDTDIHD